MNKSLTTAWVVMGTAALLLSGLLSVLITGARVPGIKQAVDIEFIQWCLVVHVNLATLIWFTALPIGLLHLSTKSRSFFSNPMSWAGFLFSLVGMILLFSVPPQEEVTPILANYIPVLSHERYYIGLAIYFMGIVLSALSPKSFANDPNIQGRWHGLYEVRFGILVGTVFLLLAVAALGQSFKELVPLKTWMTEFNAVEIGMWGGGHLIQHAAGVFIVCCWVLLLSHHLGRPAFQRQELFLVFAIMSIPIFIAPVLMFYGVESETYRRGFTFLMQWGIAPPVILFLFFALKRWSFHRSDLKSFEFMCFAMSALLLVTGFIFGAFIRGADLRVPGHYHASIGAVTLAFMGMSYIALAPKAGRWTLSTAWFYGIGQLIFAGGMFMAGAFGVPRKTYGTEQVFTHWGQHLGVGVMAIGGIGAMLGGIFFALAILPHLCSLRIKIEDGKLCLNTKSSHG